MARYFFDTEFYEDGSRIHPISFGVVKESGEKLYMEFVYKPFCTPSKWVEDHVVPHLTWEDEDKILPTNRGSLGARLLINFIGNDPSPIFWAYFASYDWIFLCQMFGTMMSLPSNFPKMCMDIQQYWIHLGKPHKSRVRPPKPQNIHNALADAKWNMEYYNNLVEYDKDKTYRC